MKDNKLEQPELHEIREWLKDPNIWRCPFEKMFHVHGCDICRAMFPKLCHACPCWRYPRSYVVRKARIVLARKGQLGRRKKGDNR